MEENDNIRAGSYLARKPFALHISGANIGEILVAGSEAVICFIERRS